MFEVLWTAYEAWQDAVHAPAVDSADELHRQYCYGRFNGAFSMYMADPSHKYTREYVRATLRERYSKKHEATA